MEVMTKPRKIVPVILSGGSGSRLWPLSREDHPKQFHSLLDSSHSILQETLGRISDPELFHSPVIVGNSQHRYLIAEQMKAFGINAPRMIIEPCARNTAPAIITAALHAQQEHGDALLLVLPTDQAIGDVAAFLSGITKAAETADKGYLVTFGIPPQYPETGYGYIRRGKALDNEVFSVSSFVEKPDAETAKRYLAANEYFWNSGMFLFSASLLLSEMEKLNPELHEACGNAFTNSHTEGHFLHLEDDAYRSLAAISIDYALMERTDRAAVVALDCGWSDLGGWESLWRLSPKDKDSNVRIGESYLMESSNCYIRNDHGPVVAGYGLEDFIVVATRDAVLIVPRNDAQQIKTLVENIRKSNPHLIAQNCQVFRPWGMYESLNSGQRHQVKRIRVKPGEKLSLQMHYHRAEHWVVVSGTARVTCDDREQILMENQSAYIPSGSVHRIENPGKIDLEIIEVQSGAYLGEDDIVRFEDQYGREDRRTAQIAKWN